MGKKVETKEPKEEKEAQEAKEAKDVEDEEPKEVEDDKEEPLKRPAAKGKAKAKAKAKGKGKTKGKGKGKSPKKTPKTPMKKLTKSPMKVTKAAKSKKKDKDEKDAKGKNKDKGLKRPAASAEAKKGSKSNSMKDQLDKLGKGIAEEKENMEEGEEEEEKEEDEEVEEEEKRDRLKSGKFQRLLKSNQVPANIKAVWQACDSRRKKTQLLNRLFVKCDRTGQWKMKANSPEFVAFLRNTDRSYSGQESQSYPKSIMLHTYYNSNLEAMQQAVRDGDIVETVGADGKLWYSFETMKEGSQRRTDNTMELHRGKVKLQQGEHSALEDTMEQFDWKQFGSPQKTGASASGSKQPLAIADQPKLIKWDAIEAHLVEAKAAQDKMMKDIQRCLPGVQKGKTQDESLVTKFREIHGTTQSNSQKISDALMWKAWCDFLSGSYCRIGGELL